MFERSIQSHGILSRKLKSQVLSRMCAQFPEKIFLDTTVVNFILDYGDQIHDGAAVPENATAWVRRDIEALRDIWITGQRANWRLTVSPTTFTEIQRTRDVQRLSALLEWASELRIYSEKCALADGDEILHEVRMTTLILLPDAGDRQLVQEAVAGGCDAFCTRDWKTILRLRDSLRDVPLLFISPHEWWQRIIPYAALFA